MDMIRGQGTSDSRLADMVDVNVRLVIYVKVMVMMRKTAGVCRIQSMPKVVGTTSDEVVELAVFFKKKKSRDQTKLLGKR